MHRCRKQCKKCWNRGGRDGKKEKQLFVAFVVYFAVEIESEQPGFILGVIANDRGFGDLAAFDQAGQANELAKFAAEIQSVTFIGHQKHISFAMIQHFQKLRYVNVV